MSDAAYPSAPEGTALARLFESLAALDVEYAGAIANGGKFACPNPEHDDEHPSFDVHVGRNGKPIFTCTPCREAMGTDGFIEVLREAGVRWNGDPVGFDDAVEWGEGYQGWAPQLPGKKTEGNLELTARYKYNFSDGSPNFIVRRFDPVKGSEGRKFFQPARYERGKGYQGGRGALDGVRRTPYKLEEFADWTEAEGRTARVLYLVEGEKAAEAVLEAGRPATTFHGGTAGKLEADWTDWFLGFREVRIWPDADEAGVKWARARAEELRAIEDGPEISFWGVPATTKTKVKGGDDAADLLGRHKPTRLTEKQLDDLAALKPLPTAPEATSRGPRTVTLPDGTVLVSASAGGAPAPSPEPARKRPYRNSPTIEPYKFAEEFIDRWLRDEDGALLLRFHDDEQFWRWDAKQARYRLLSAHAARERVSRLLRDARVTNGDGEVVPIALKPRTVSDVIEALRSDTLASEFSHAGPLLPAKGGVPFRNGWLDVSTGDLLKIGPERDVRWNVPLTYDPENVGAVTEWFAFLDSLGWTEGTDERRLLRQWYGYLLSGRTDQQKSMLLIGPKRAGKGTILKVAHGMLGDGAVGTQLDRLESNFGLQNMIGSGLVTIGDARFGLKTSSKVVERILSITSDDPMEVDVKNKNPISVRLGTRLMIGTNEMPNFLEASDAVASRFRALKFTETFFGREDLDLEDKIMAELPGIVHWSLGGLRDLDQTGHFTDTAAGAEIQEQMVRESAPVRVFVEECCELGPNFKIENNKLYAEYTLWAEQNRMFVLNSVKFARDLLTAFPGEIRNGSMKRGGRGIRAKYGIRLR